MTRLVVDASVTLAWIFKDETNSYAETILRSLKNRSVIVPSHWMLELTNAVLSAERKGRITTADSTRGFALIEGLPITVDGYTSEKASSQTMFLARAYRLTTYDAAYLELSLREGISLATLDTDLIAACKQSGGTLA